MFKRCRCFVVLVALGLGSHSFAQVELANLREDVRGLSQRLGELALKVEQLERENRELRQANEILRKASAYFAQAELDRRFKP